MEAVLHPKLSTTMSPSSHASSLCWILRSYAYFLYTSFEKMDICYGIVWLSGINNSCSRHNSLTVRPSKKYVCFGSPDPTYKIYRGYKMAATFRGVVGWCKGAVYLTSPGRPTDIGLQLGKACYPCSG